MHYKISSLKRHLQYDLDLPSANDARVLVCYYADRMMDRGADGPRLSTAPYYIKIISHISSCSNIRLPWAVSNHCQWYNPHGIKEFLYLGLLVRVTGSGYILPRRSSWSKCLFSGSKQLTLCERACIFIKYFLQR